MRSSLLCVALGLVACGLTAFACSSGEESSPGTGGNGTGGTGATGGQHQGGGGANVGGLGGGGASAGGGGASAGGGGASVGGGGSSAGGGGAGGAGGAAPVAARLFVSMANAPVAVWEDASNLAADSGPSFSLGHASVATGARGLALGGERLFVGGEDPNALLLAFDAASTLTAGAAPAAVIPSAQFVAAGGSEGADLVTVDGASNTVWATTFLAGTELFEGASAMTSASTASALMTHAWQQLPAFAYDPVGNRAFLGQISGAGLLVWNDPLGANGTPALAFTLAADAAPWSMAIAENRLYAIGRAGSAPPAEVIAVWDGVSGLASPTAPSFTLGAASGIGVNDFSPYVGVHGDVLVACIQSGKVLLWTNASALSGNTAPTQTLGGLASPLKALLGPKSGRLYVLETDGVSVFDTPTTAPTLAVKLTTGVTSPRDMALFE